MIQKQRILFVCIHNSARSQMAEAFMKRECKSGCEIESAGIESGVMNPLVVEVMLEKGIDLSQKTTQTIEAVLGQAKQFTHVITVCDEASHERCPFIPGVRIREHWNVPDPSAMTGSYTERSEQTRLVRDEIEARAIKWCRENCTQPIPT
jgi:arsenate reductase